MPKGTMRFLINEGETKAFVKTPRGGQSAVRPEAQVRVSERFRALDASLDEQCAYSCASCSGLDI